METAAAALTVGSALFGAVMAGVYVGFDVIVMPGLRRLPAPAAVRAMQRINRAAVGPGFMVFFFGSAILAVAALVVASIASGPDTFTRLLGNVLIASGLVTTIAINVPRNNAIDALDPDAAGTPERWSSLESGWRFGNRLRGATALAGAVALLLTLA